MFGLGYVDPALISAVIRRGPPIPSTMDPLATKTLRPFATPVSDSWREPNAHDQVRIDAMLDDIAQQIPIAVNPDSPIDQRIVNFWLQFDPEGPSFSETLASVASTWGAGQAGEGRLVPLYAMRDRRNRAFEEARRQYPDTSEHNNLTDVFRHAYASSLLTQFFGERDAKRLMDAYERSNPNPPAERYGDLFVNRFGRGIEGHPGLEGIDRIFLLRRAIELGLLPPSGRLPIR